MLNPKFDVCIVVLPGHDLASSVSFFILLLRHRNSSLTRGSPRELISRHEFSSCYNGTRPFRPFCFNLSLAHAFYDVTLLQAEKLRGEIRRDRLSS